MPWEKGTSGNPSGRCRGDGKVAKLRTLLEPHAQALVEKTVQLALGGDTTALRLRLERLIPPVKPKDEPVRVGFLRGDGMLSEQGRDVLRAMGKGALTPSEGAALLQALATEAKIIEVDELELRIRDLEENVNSSGDGEP